MVIHMYTMWKEGEGSEAAWKQGKESNVICILFVQEEGEPSLMRRPFHVAGLLPSQHYYVCKSLFQRFFSIAAAIRVHLHTNRVYLHTARNLACTSRVPRFVWLLGIGLRRLLVLDCIWSYEIFVLLNPVLQDCG